MITIRNLGCYLIVAALWLEYGLRCGVCWLRDRVLA